MIKPSVAKKLFLVIVTTSLLLRVYQLEDLAIFDYDQETAALAVKGILVDKKLTLIGQEISIGGVYIGPLYYYLLVPFFAVSKMDPLAANIMTSLISILTISTLYYVGNKLFSRNAGIIAALFYGFSNAAISNDINSVPSNPIILISTLLFYFFFKFLSGEPKYLFPISILFGLIFHFHPSAIPLIFVFLTTILLRKVKFDLKITILSFISFFLIVSPLIVFDFRHQFLVSKNLINFLNSRGIQDVGFVGRLWELTIINTRNFGSFFLSGLQNKIFPFSLIALLLLVAISLKDSKKKLVDLIFVLWVIIPVAVFVFYKGNISEYYFAVSTPIILLMFSQKVSNLYLRGRGMKIAAILFLTLFLIINFNNRLHNFNPLSLKYKKELVSFISKDTGKNPFNVYIDTDLGYSNGYKYLFYYYGIQPQDGPFNLYIITAPYDTRMDYQFNKAAKNYPNSNIIKYKFGNLGVLKIIPE